MSTDSNGVPLTRRQIREQAAAAAAAAAAGGLPSAARPPVSSSGGGAPTAGRPTQAPREQLPASRARADAQPSRGVPPTRDAQPSRSQQRPAAQQPSRPAPPQVPAPSQAPAAQQSRVGHSRVQQPSRESRTGDQGQGAALSRRSLREQTGVQRPVVVPPVQSNAIRTVDETGELSALRDLGTGRTPRTAPSNRPAEPAPSQVSQPFVQRQPVQREPVQREPAQRRTGMPVPPRQPVQQPGTQQPGVQRQSLQGLPTRLPGETGTQREQAPAQPGLFGADPVRRPWPPVEPVPGSPTGAPAAFRSAQPARPAVPVADVDLFQQRISAPDEAPVQEDAEEDVFVDELPRWDAITTPGARTEPRSTPPVAQPAAADDLDDDDLDDDDLDDDDDSDHKYTWLHYLILVAVAFVLGLIIWKVGLEGRGEASPPGTTSSAGITLHSEHTVSDLYL